MTFFEEPIAQPVEHLTFNQRVDGSNPSGLTNKIKDLDREQRRTAHMFYNPRHHVLQIPFLARSAISHGLPFENRGGG